MAEPVRQILTESTLSPTPIVSQELFTERLSESRFVRQAYKTLQLGFTVALIIAGLDKFFHILVNWDQYLAPQVQDFLGGNGHNFMLGVGVIEIVAGIGVALKPKIFGYIVSAWLVGIIVNLLISGNYYDIALRDLGLSMGAFALARLSHVFDDRTQRID